MCWWLHYYIHLSKQTDLFIPKEWILLRVKYTLNLFLKQEWNNDICSNMVSQAKKNIIW